MPKKDKPPAERLALHIDTAYGPIEVRENKTTRSLYFGEKKAVQSFVSLVTPDALIPPYTRYMFSFLLFQPPPQTTSHQ